MNLPARTRQGLLVTLVVVFALPFAGTAKDTAADHGQNDPHSDHAHANFTSTSVFPGTYHFSEKKRSAVLENGTFGSTEFDTVNLTSQIDGVLIQVAILHPLVPADVRVPVLVIASLYFPDFSNFSSLPNAFHVGWAIENFLPHGYAIALIPVRGTGGSGGCFQLLGPKEIADIDQAVTWLGEQEWANGAIGMLGESYDAITPWGVAALGNKYLRTVVAFEGSPAPPAILLRNGTVAQGAPAAVGNYQSYSILHAFATALFAEPHWVRPAGAIVGAFSCPEASEPFLAVTTMAATGEYDPFGFAASRDFRAGLLANYEGSALVVHGLRDGNIGPATVWPWINELERQGVRLKQVLGQWEHDMPDVVKADDPLVNPTPRWDMAEITLHWLDRWLKHDVDTDLGPRVQVADQYGQWRDEQAWPPQNTTPLEFILTSDRSLAQAGGLPGNQLLVPSPTRLFAAANRSGVNTQEIPCGTFAEFSTASRATCVEFSTAPIANGIRFAGLPQAHIKVVPLSYSGQLSADLYVEKDGHRKFVGRGTIDLHHAEGGSTSNAIVPGQALTARLELDPMDVVVPPGGRVVLSLHAGGTGSGRSSGSIFYVSPVPSGPMQVIVGGASSVLRLATFDRPETVFFDPPEIGVPVP